MSAAAAATATPRLVTTDAFEAAQASARSIRIHQYTLWSLGPKSNCCAIYADSDADADPPMVWTRRTANSDKELLLNFVEYSTNVKGLRLAWLITEEHRDILDNLYSTTGEPIDPAWQPQGPALLRTTDNPTHWIPVQRLIPWHFMASIAVTEIDRPADWLQPRKPHYLEENDVWVHFIPHHGPFVITQHISKFQAPRLTTPAMRAFLADTPLTDTPSAAEMTSAVLGYINKNMLMPSSRTQRVYPDQKLRELLGSSEPFPLTGLQRLLAPHYGDFVI